MEGPEIQFKIDERTTRALHAAVTYTLERWAGEGDMDQEQLLLLKPFLQGCVFEFDFHRAK